MPRSEAVMSRLGQGLRFAHVLTMPGAARSFVRTRPFSSSAFLVARDLHRGCGEFGTIVDVGANAGQFSLAMARHNPSARILAVEPLPDVAAALRENVRGHGHIEVVECAAGAATGTAPMHRHAYTLSSSMLATTQDFASVFPGAAHSGSPRDVEVRVRRLDDVVDEHGGPAALTGPVLLKLDVQGFEIEALKGAPELLRHCDFVLAEAALDRVYDGEPLFDDLHAHLRGEGFEFDRPVDFLRGAQGRVSQMDVLYRRGTTR